jgi:hypothetical protein
MGEIFLCTNHECGAVNYDLLRANRFTVPKLLASCMTGPAPGLARSLAVETGCTQLSSGVTRHLQWHNYLVLVVRNQKMNRVRFLRGFHFKHYFRASGTNMYEHICQWGFVHCLRPGRGVNKQRAGETTQTLRKPPLTDVLIHVISRRTKIMLEVKTFYKTLAIIT